MVQYQNHYKVVIKKPNHLLMMKMLSIIVLLLFDKIMKTFEQFMPTFVGNEMIQINPDISSNQQLHIFITHDECLFYANDDRPIIWAPIGEPSLRKKGQGKSIMVSDFLLETIGRLK